MDSPTPSFFERLLALFGRDADPVTRHWAKSDRPLPEINLATGTFGDLRFEDRLEKAEFLGRPDRTKRSKVAVDLYYPSRGFSVSFELDRFVELHCYIAPYSDSPPKKGEKFCEPRLIGVIQLTSATTIAQVRQCFGTPKSDDDYSRNKVLTFVRGRFYMNFEFEQPKEQLRLWTLALDD